MDASDLYGFNGADLEGPRQSIEKALGVQMDLHESSYIAGEEYYLATLPDGEKFSLQLNYDEWEKDWAEEDFKDFGVLLYVYSPRRAEEIQTILTNQVPGISFLQRTVITQDRKFQRMRVINGKATVILEKQLEPEGK